MIQLVRINPGIFPYLASNNKTPGKDKGLSELVRLCFGKPLNKSEQCSNWERRPLRNAQLLYAGKNYTFIISFTYSSIYILATDAYCLVEIYKFLSTSLQSPDYLKSFRGRKPKRLEATIARHIDENFNETVDINNRQVSTIDDAVPVCNEKTHRD